MSYSRLPSAQAPIPPRTPPTPLQSSSFSSPQSILFRINTLRTPSLSPSTPARLRGTPGNYVQSFRVTRTQRRLGLLTMARRHSLKAFQNRCSHLTSFLSYSSALFSAMGHSQPLSRQSFPHSFHHNGGYTSPSSKVPYILPSSVCSKSFVSHSYENCRGVYPSFPFRNRQSAKDACSEIPVSPPRLTLT